MYGKSWTMVTLLIGLALLVIAVSGANEDGKYSRSKYDDSGRYVPSNQGRYVPMNWPYMHVHDNRELGKYVHVHIPYDGGYGPYSGDIDKYRYTADTSGQYSHDKYTTTTTTTPRPRIRYDDEGKWRIIRQEENKNQKKYDFLYLTENGIYAEEQAQLQNKNQKADGTMGQGYYEYTGDDGELYRVVYSSGEQGFIPMGAHIPSQLQKALAYLAAKDRVAK